MIQFKLFAFNFKDDYQYDTDLSNDYNYQSDLGVFIKYLLVWFSSLSV